MLSGTAGGGLTTLLGASDVEGANLATQEAIPYIRIDGQLSGRAVVSDEGGSMYLIDANNGTIRRLRWE